MHPTSQTSSEKDHSPEKNCLYDLWGCEILGAPQTAASGPPPDACLELGVTVISPIFLIKTLNCEIVIMDTIMNIGFLIAVMSRTTSRQDRLKLCMIMMALMSLQHQEDRIQRLIMNRDSRNMQHFLMMNMRSDPSGVSHPLECDIMITIETGNDEEFRSMFRVSRPVFLHFSMNWLHTWRDGRSRN